MFRMAPVMPIMPSLIAVAEVLNSTYVRLISTVLHVKVSEVTLEAICRCETDRINHCDDAFTTNEP